MQILAAQSFLKALDSRRREGPLIDGALECIARIHEDIDAPGLNKEVIFNSRGIDVCSARINRQFRLIFATPSVEQVILLHFDNHDEAYDWATSARDRIAKLADKATEWQGIRPSGSPPAIPALDEDTPIPIDGVPALREMITGGLNRYLAYLSDEQRHLAEFDFRERRGLMFIKGGAGTGKTAIAIHRLLHLARIPELDGGDLQYLCFNRVLSDNVRRSITSLVPPESAPQIKVATFHEWCGYYLNRVEQRIEAHNNYREWLQAGISRSIPQLGLSDLLGALPVPEIATEIMDVLKAWGVTSEEEYLELERAGRGTPMQEPQRRAIWRIYQQVRPEISGTYDMSDIPAHALRHVKQDKDFLPYRYLVIDEAQDCTPAMAELARTLVGGDDRRLMVLADPAQSIYANGFHIARRAFSPRGAQNVVLRQPYRSTKRIQALAVSLFAQATREERETVDLREPPREGEPPTVRVEPDAGHCDTALVESIRQRIALDSAPTTLRNTAVLTSTNRERDRLVEMLRHADIPAQPFDRNQSSVDVDAVKVATVHAVKGMEFPVIYVYCPTRMHGQTDSAFRNLVYVACTRSSHALTLLLNIERIDPVLKEFAQDTYSLTGSASDLF